MCLEGMDKTKGNFRGPTILEGLKNKGDLLRGRRGFKR
jgi:hypothetical protein